MLTWRQRFEACLALAMAEAVAWIVLAREIRRRVERQLDEIDARVVDLSAAVHHHEVN